MDVGSTLREARERAGLTREAVSDRTKIQLAKVEALEANAFERLPDGIYLDGLIRAYANEVGLDGSELVAALRRDNAATAAEVFESEHDLLHIEPAPPPAVYDHRETPYDDRLTPYDDREIVAAAPLRPAPEAVAYDVAPPRHRTARFVLPVLALLAAVGLGAYLYQRSRPFPQQDEIATPAVSEENAQAAAQSSALGASAAPLTAESSRDANPAAAAPGNDSSADAIRANRSTMPVSPSASAGTDRSTAAPSTSGPPAPAAGAPAAGAPAAVAPAPGAPAPGAQGAVNARTDPSAPALGTPPPSTPAMTGSGARGSGAPAPGAPAPTARRAPSAPAASAPGAAPSAPAPGAPAPSSADVPSPSASGAPEPGAPDAPAPSAPSELSGFWTLDTRVESSSLNRFEGLQLGYRLELRQNGGKIVGEGVKVRENGQSVAAPAQTPIIVEGTLMGNRLTLTFSERGRRRESAGKMILDVHDDGVLRGRFSSSAAQSSGTAEARRPEG